MSILSGLPPRNKKSGGTPTTPVITGLPKDDVLVITSKFLKLKCYFSKLKRVVFLYVVFMTAAWLNYHKQKIKPSVIRAAIRAKLTTETHAFNVATNLTPE